MFSFDNTIAAIASAQGGEARGIVRFSGPAMLEIVSRCFRPADAAISLEAIKVPTAIDGAAIGRAATSQDINLPATLFLWPTARSYTRQPLAEFHTIGSPPLLDWLLQTVCNAGARLAQPGEFTLRAFLAGRIDLTQAEAVLGVIDAADRRQLDTALAQLAGGLSMPLQLLRDDLLNLLADLEAGLDFVEEDIRFVDRNEMDQRLRNAAGQLESLAQQLAERGDASRLPCVALVGAPNVGKSSLFNALVQSDSALVSPVAGTTRDYLAAKIHCNGLEVRLIDTAGIHSDLIHSPIDEAAQQLAAGQRAQADLSVLCLDATRPASQWERQQQLHENTLVVWTKSDLATTGEGLLTSSRTGSGLDELRTKIAAVLSARPDESHAVVGTAARARESIRLAAAAITDAHGLAIESAGEELIAAELRLALEELGKVVGAIYTDDLLDRIFSRFCIGK
jgi:tRNA modification GTPase